MRFDLLKPQFAFSFWCFPQAKAALTYSKAVFAFSFWCFPQAKGTLTYSKAVFAFSNPSLLSHFSVFRKQKEL